MPCVIAYVTARVVFFTFSGDNRKFDTRTYLLFYIPSISFYRIVAYLLSSRMKLSYVIASFTGHHHALVFLFVIPRKVDRVCIPLLVLGSQRNTRQTFLKRLAHRASFFFFFSFFFPFFSSLSSWKTFSCSLAKWSIGNTWLVRLGGLEIVLHGNCYEIWNSSLLFFLPTHSFIS